jgi:hypothetical protein
VGFYWIAALSAFQNGTVESSSSSLDGYGWASSWRCVDDASSTISGAPLHEGSVPWAWIVETATMKIVKNETATTFLDIPAEVAALNN